MYRLSNYWFIKWVSQFIILDSSALCFVSKKVIEIRSKALISLFVGIFNNLIWFVPENFVGSKSWC